MKRAFILFAVLFLTIPCFAADTIFLKSGQKVSGKILEKTDEKVRIEVGGVALTYWPDSIDHISVEGEVAAIAVKLYQLDKGNLPSKLDDLVPQYLAKVPDDAYDGFKPIKYMQKPNGYLVYSLGPDRVDQKGNVVCDFIGGPDACDIAMFVKQ